MNIAKTIGCKDFPCVDVDHQGYVLPEIDIDPERIFILMIAECGPEDPNDYFYAGNSALFEKTTVQAFNDAGAEVSSIEDILELGVYLTTAIKCRKKEYVIKANTIKECSKILENEISLFPNIKAFMLMGDAAIKSFNYIAKSVGEKRIIPAGSTYKIRGDKYYFKERRVFPSYLQAGPSFFIEKSKRRMISEDISEGLNLLL
jgi:uracil-DNA glycosylase